MVRSFGELADVGHELITMARDCENELMMPRQLYERFAQGRDVARKSVFLNRSLWPDDLEKLILIDNARTALDERQEDLEGLRSQRNQHLIPPEKAAALINDI